MQMLQLKSLSFSLVCIECAIYRSIQLQICSSRVLKSLDRGPESYNSVHAKNLRFTATIFCHNHGMSVLSQYFHLVSTKCKMNKILDIFIYLKYNKTNLKTPFENQDGNKYLHVNLIDYILTPSWVPSKFALDIFLPHTLNVFSLHGYL